jgi:raffinose/stachyose/melibiose transport system substrate-binding protein
MNRIRLFWGLSVLTILAMLLAGCGTKAATEAPTLESAAPTATPVPPTPAPPEKATVTLWTDPPGGGEAATCFAQTVVDPFNEQSDTVFVEVTYQPEAWDAIRTALAGGAGPDIVDTPGPSFVYELVQAGQLLALDEFVPEFGWDELFVPWALSLGEVEGELYSIADELETLILYYNSTLFEEKGWEPPTTIDEMYALAAKIADDGVIPFSHGNGDWRPANEWFVGEWLNHVAGPDKVYEALTGKRPWTDPDFVRAIELLDEAQQKGWFMGGLEFYYTTGWDDYIIALVTGEAAMKVEGTWVAGALIEQLEAEDYGDNDWDWVPMPSTSGEAIFDLGMGHTWSVNKDAENPRAAAEFLTYFFSPEVQARRFRECDLVPGPIRLTADALEGIDPRMAGMIVALAEASDAGNYGYTTWTFWPPKSDVYIYEEIERVWAGEITAKEYLAGLQALFEEEFAAGEIPPIPDR